MTQFLATVLPSIILVYFFVTQDRFPEPKKIIIITFILGILITIPAGFLNVYLMFGSCSCRTLHYGVEDFKVTYKHVSRIKSSHLRSLTLTRKRDRDMLEEMWKSKNIPFLK